ncbi:MAG: carboxypeptidase-like regulatory domain-containing protein, partial [Flavobacterium sp.]|nr:carboxypeptidase-like regulatory domain-containing protein [Flavobacterium sp.]
TPIDAGSPRYASDFAYLLSETTFYDYSSFVDRNFTTPKFSIVIPQEAIQKDDEFWMQNRPSPLDSRSLHTYAALDSIAQSAGVERKLLLGRKVINGYVPVGFFDVDLRYLASFNNYEGFRLGFGGKTNDRFSKKFRLEGYTAYGTKDGEFKYQLGGSVRVGNTSDTWIGLSYTDDIREIASTNFAVDKRTYKIYDPRPINVSTFYNYVSWRAYAQTRIIPAAETIWQFSHNLIRPQFNYAYLHDGQYYRNFSLTAAMVSIQWNPFSDFMQTPDGIIESEKRFPKFTFQFTQAIPNVMGNDLEFGKIEIRSAYEKKFLNQQKFSALFEAGRAYGNLPITHAYNTSPNNLDKDRLLQRVTFAGKDSFETMYFNEFFSDRFAFTQFKYAFGRLMISDKIKPTPVLATRMVWGAIDNRDKHIGINFNTLNHGYYESGIELNGIFKGLGLSAFYRYGAYHLPDLEDNIAVKLSFVINIGF